ncbi:MAG: glycoside hydrolase family 127 protein [Anaerolineales bacterium]|nr:glycoside hydrolase family 127 protein [Anaerolineales bacterium]
MAEVDPFAIVQPKPEALAWLPFGAVRPAGWLAAQMRRDLEAGFVGRLDQLAPALIQADDIYGRDRLTRQAGRKDLGVLAVEAEWDVQFQWWNSETQSNWWDGVVRSALLLEQPEYLRQAAAYVDGKLATQDADGYLGIYAPDLRFNFDGENGELWAQAALLRTLLGYFEFTREARVLAAVERAVAVVMRAYPLHASHPFTVRKSFAGVGHGLVFTDVLDRLRQLTGRADYARYALWLYQEYSQSEQSQADIQYQHLIDPAYRFQAHGVHTYEHLRPLLAAGYASGNPALERALRGYLDKLERCLTPSGGPIGDEFIAGREADAAATGYEYCSIQELLDSYTHLLQKTGAAEWGDRAEWLCFNAGQGARHPEASAIAYLKTDNSYAMTGPRDPADPPLPEGPQTRYKYSPVHQDVAVCCVPNAGRLLPTYVKAMWLRTPAGLAAALYGPGAVEADVNGTAVRITAATHYPLELAAELVIEAAAPVRFELALRRPAWAEAMTWSAPALEASAEQAGWLRLTRRWVTGDRVRVEFQAAPVERAFGAAEVFVSRGPLVYALPLAATETFGREYASDGFQDRYYHPDQVEGGRYELGAGRWQVIPSVFSDAAPWRTAPALAGELYDPVAGQMVPAVLRPLGDTVLRQVTFHRRRWTGTSI